MGFIVDGWSSGPGMTERISTLTQGSIGDTTLYAKWIELFDVNFIITTDGTNAAKNVDVVINETFKMISDELGLADTIVPNGSSFNYTIEINGIIIEEGTVTVSGSDVRIEVEIVDCYMRWYDVIFCDNGPGLWTGFAWYSNGSMISAEQFFHNPGGIEDGTYKLLITSVAGIEYTWEKEFVNGNFEGNVYQSNGIQESKIASDTLDVKVYPCPIQRNQEMTVVLSENMDLQNTIILIFDVRGSQILKISDPFYINEILIDDNFSPGTYYVLITNKKNKETKVVDVIIN